MSELDDCPICLEPLSGDKSQDSQMPCSHIFHIRCLQACRENCGSRCPMCRADLPPDPKDVFDYACRIYFQVKKNISESYSWDSLNEEDRNKLDIVIGMWTKAAKDGSALAMTNMGFIFRKGRGVKQCFKTSVFWYKEAAAHDSLNAICNLGLAYFLGRGVPKCEKQAVVWYRKAAERGYSTAQFNLGLMQASGQGVEQNLASAASWYQLAARDGHTDAQNNLGSCHYHGRGLACKNLEEAAYWFGLAAEKGHADAQTNLGLMYERGEGLEQNISLAIHWYRKASAQNHVDATFNLGAMCERGYDGILEQSDVEALRLFRIAGTRGCAQAQHNCGVMLHEGRGDKKDYKEAIHWYKLAARHQHIDSIVNLAIMNENGEGMNQNLLSAYDLFSQAAALGDKVSKAEALRVNNMRVRNEGNKIGPV